MHECLDEVPCGVLSFTDAGNVLEVNAMLLDLLGYGRSELVGTPLDGILTLGSRAFFQTHLLPLLRLKGRLEEIYLVVRTRDAQELEVLINATRREREGVWVNHCAVFPMRERRRYEEELLSARKAADQARAALEMQRAQLQAANETLVQRTDELDRQRLLAEQANRAKSTFLSFMSHELRTPLSSILGFGQLLQFSELEPDDQESVEQILTAGRHLLVLINEVLDLSAIEAGQVPLELEPVDLADGVRMSVEMVRMLAAERGIRIEQREVPGGARRVVADRRRLHQVLLNLLSNAVKYNVPGGAVAVEFDELPAGGLRVLVQDTGPGIAPAKLGQLFRPFERLDAGTGPIQGTGLGLAVCKGLIAAMGGRIGVESEVGVGSTFWIELPEAITRAEPWSRGSARDSRHVQASSVAAA